VREEDDWQIELMRGIGNLCIGRDSDPRYDPAAWSNCSSRDYSDRSALSVQPPVASPQ